MTLQGLFILFFVTAVVWATWNATRKPPSQRRTLGDGMSRELLQATKGDYELAQRLIRHARTKYPGKPDHWYLDKVLYDLARDGAGGASSAKDFRRSRNSRTPGNPAIQGLWNPLRWIWRKVFGRRRR